MAITIQNASTRAVHAVSISDMCTICNDIRFAMTSVAVYNLVHLPADARHHILQNDFAGCCKAKIADKDALS